MKASHCFTEMADALAVSKSGFFAHERKEERPRRQQDNHLLEQIEPLFVASRRPTAVLVSCMHYAKGDITAGKTAPRA